MKAPKSCAAHKQNRKKPHHASFWQILLKIQNFFENIKNDNFHEIHAFFLPGFI